MNFVRKVTRRATIKFRKAKNRNRTSYPRLSGDFFASLSDHVIQSDNDIQNFEQLDISPRESIVFVKSDFLETALGSEALLSTCRVLICGNSDRNFDTEFVFPPEIKKVFLQNSCISDGRKIMTLPIGVENVALGRFVQDKYISFCGGQKFTNKVLVPPMSNTNPVRPIIRCQAESLPELFDNYEDYIHEKEYFELSSQYQFVLCLIGNGHDSHRLWETLYQGNFPVVIRDSWSQSLEYLELPILLVDSILDISTELLKNYLAENPAQSPEMYPSLWPGYWVDRFTSQ
jgi:hypothetical protein